MNVYDTIIHSSPVLVCFVLLKKNAGHWVISREKKFASHRLGGSEHQ